MIDHRIPLQARGPNVVNALSQGARAAALQNSIENDRRMRELYATYGPRIMRGDKAALDELASLDPMLAARFEQMAYQRGRRGRGVPKFDAANAFTSIMGAAGATETPAGQNSLLPPPRATTAQGESLLPPPQEDAALNVTRSSRSALADLGVGSPLESRMAAMESPAQAPTQTAGLNAIAKLSDAEVTAPEPEKPGMTMRPTGDADPFPTELAEKFRNDPDTQAEVRKHPDKLSFRRAQYEEAAAAVEAGQLPSQHLNSYLAMIDRVADIMYEDAPKRSEAEQEIARLMELGMSREDAIRLKEGVTTILTDPTTNQPFLIDKQSGTAKPLALQAQSGAEQQAAETVPVADVPGDAGEAFGLEGLVKRWVNAGTDFAGFGHFFENAAEQERFFKDFDEKMLVSMAQAYPRMPATQQMERLRQLTTAGASGPADAELALKALADSLERDMGLAKQKLRNPMKPNERQGLISEVQGFESALQHVREAQARFKPAGGGNTTSSGVQWKVVD